MPVSRFAGSESAPRSGSGVREFIAGAGFKEKFLPIGPVQDLYARAQRSEQPNILQAILDEMQAEVVVPASELNRVPPTGPLLVVCNQPFGILESMALGALLHRSRSDVKLLAHPVLSSIDELDAHCLYLDSFAVASNSSTNASVLLRCVRWLRAGRVLVVFPENVTRRTATEAPGWSPAIGRLARITGAAALPVFFKDRNRAAAQALGLLHPGLVHPSLRPALLLNEFLAQKGRDLSLRVGRVVPAKALASMEDHNTAARYLQWRTQLLGRRTLHEIELATKFLPKLPKKKAERLTRPIPKDALLADIENLRPDQILDDGREFSVFVAREHEIPNILPELGRLREATFRESGEGTGRCTDLDAFDRYYSHIVLWSKQNHEPVGAYRIGRTQDILPLRGIDGLYTSTLFRYEPRFFAILGPALELGRSFVRPEYQRQYAPLLLLWKGIARYIATHPETPVLFGAVSVSGSYSLGSRELIFRFFESRKAGNGVNDLSALVQPRKPFRPGRIGPWDCRSICRAMRELDEINDPISDMESDGKGVPILLKHYSRLGGELLGFNVDSKFSQVLDGLIVMDLRKTPPSSLERYMGESGLAAFRRYHGLPTQRDRH